MELTSEKKEELVNALAVIQEVCNSVSSCECCPLRTQFNYCSLQHEIPEHWNLNTTKPGEWRAFK